MRKSPPFAAAALIGLLVLLGVPSSSCHPAAAPDIDSGPEEVTCNQNSDCAAALDAGNCVDGVCQICTSSSQCADTAETCVNGTCVVVSGTGGSGSAGSTSSGGSTGGGEKPDAGCGLPGQCTSSCCCTDSSTPACESGTCAAKPATCQRNNDCACDEICSAGTCEPKCSSNSDCKNPLPFCYLPQGQCGPCTSDSNCPTGQSCVSGACQATPDGGCTATHCCNNGNCPGSDPVCSNTTYTCGPCTSSVQCSPGYACVSGACKSSSPDAGCGPNGCPSGEVCQGTTCVTATCNPPCGAPATCGANNSCVCPTNCNNICGSGQTCDMTTCQCGVATGGSIGGSIGGSLGGLIGGSLGGLIGGSIGSSLGGSGATCSTTTCSGCPSGETCYCADGNACSSSDWYCYIGYLGLPGTCQ